MGHGRARTGLTTLGAAHRRRSVITVAVISVLSLVASSCGGSSSADPAVEASGSSDQEFATVVKIDGISWFDRMEIGVSDFEQDNTGLLAYQEGPAEANAEQQVEVLENLIAKKVDVINIVPFDLDSVEPVLERARSEGIVVISHEAPSVINVDWDIEAFDNEAYGQHLMDLLAEDMGEEGEYAVVVGSVTSESHNQWVDAAVEHQKATYPKMKLVGGKNESRDTEEGAYESAKELLETYPNLRGFQGSAANDVIGFGRAVEESGLEDRLSVVGTGVPSDADELLGSGAVDVISFWDPALAGYAMNTVAKLVIDGAEVSDGMDLGLEGYESVAVEGKVITGTAWIDATAENVSNYDF